MNWKKSNFPGVRYREHKTRKHGLVKDRYFAIRYQLGGRRREEALGWASEGWTERKAALELEKLKSAYRLGEGPTSLRERRKMAEKKRQVEQEKEEILKQEAITFEQIFNNHYSAIAKANKKVNSYRTEEILFRLWIAPIIGALPLKDIAPIHLERLKKQMSDAGRTARTICYALATIRQVFYFAQRHNLYNGPSPIINVKMPHIDNRRHRFLTHEEAEKLLTALRERSLLTYEIALISLYCGLRAGEIFSLTWQDLDFEHGIMMLRDTKGGRDRAAFMTEVVKEMLLAKPKGEPDALVFPGRDGVKINSISNSFDRVVKTLGFNEGITDARQRVVFHSLRHTFASWLVEGGVDLYKVKTLLGHSTIALTERYSHLGANSLQEAIKILDHASDLTLAHLETMKSRN